MPSWMSRRSSLPTLVVVALLAGCAHGTRSATTVWGVAVADHPIEGAMVSVMSAQGEVLAAMPAATGPHGDFAVAVIGLTDQYTVVVTGGTRDGRPLGGDLKAMATFADAAGGISVSPVSSLAAEYAAARPGLSPGAALAKVKEALGIPAETDTRSLLSSTEATFDTERYMVAAGRSGGLDPHEAKLVTRLDGAAPGSLGADGSLTDELLMEAVKGAAGAAGSQAAGWVLSKAGVQGDTDGLSDIKQQLAEIQSELQALNLEIQAVYLKELTAEILSRDQSVRAGMAQVKECATPPVDPNTLATALDNGASLRKQADASPQPFAGVLTGSSGLFAAYRHVKSDERAYWRQAEVDGIRGQFGYYSWLQACEYLLVTENCHATDKLAPSPDTASPAVANTIRYLGDLYLGSLALQRKTYGPPILRLPAPVIYSTKANLMVAYGMVACWGDKNYAPEKKGIRRSDKDYNPGKAVTHFNKEGGGPGGYKDWRLPTEDEIKVLFSGHDFDDFYETRSGEPNHLAKGRIIWTDDWEKGKAYDSDTRKFFNVNATFDVDTPPDKYDGVEERYSPGPASILFVRSVERVKEGYWKP